MDISIGLRDDESARTCDVEARKLLGNRRSSVFPAPCRAALGATSHTEASKWNRQVSGKGLSQQTFHILHKIAEVDVLLRADRQAQQVIREVHPEVLFWALNDGVPMSNRKKRSVGFHERVVVLERHYKGATELIEEAGREYRRYEVARDDIVDALAAAVTARIAQGDYKTLPESVEADQKGIRMEMVYT